MKKSSIIYILALVMIVTLSIALINIDSAKAADTLATGTVDDPYFTVEKLAYFTGDSSYSYSNGIGSDSGSYTGKTTSTTKDDSDWCIIKVTFRNTGTFSYTSNMTKYSSALSESTSKNDYYYLLVTGDYSDAVSGESIQSGSLTNATTILSGTVSEKNGEKTHSNAFTIKKSDLTDGRATLYFAFASTYHYRKIISTYEKTDQIVFSDMSFTYVNPDSTVTLSTTTGNIAQISCNGSALTSNSITVETGATVTLTANPSSGNQFYFWTVNGSYYADTQTVTVPITGDTTIVADVRPTGYYVTRNGGTFYHSLNTFYEDNPTGTAVVLKGCAIIDEDVTVPAGAKLFVPYSADVSASTTTYYEKLGANSQHKPAWKIPDTYRYSQLVISNGATLTVNGKLVVFGTYGWVASSSGTQGVLTGNYGEIVNNGSIIVNNSASTEVYGLMTGDGNYITNNGSTTTVVFTIIDFEGGTNTTAYEGTTIFPFSQYTFQSIWCKQRINYGSIVKSRAELYGKLLEAQFFECDPQNVISTSNALLLWDGDENAYIDLDYDENKVLKASVSYDISYYGTMSIEFHGKVKAGSLNISYSMIGSFGGIDVDSADYTFVVPYNFNITVADGGTLTIPNGLEFAMLPGSVLNVKKGGTLDIQSGAILYVLDGLAIRQKSSVRYPYATELQANNFSASAQLFVDGTMTIGGTFAGLVQSTGNTGKIVVDSNATLGINDFQLGIAKTDSGVDNITKMDIAARFGRNSIATSNGVSSDNSFVTMEKGKTYYALTNVGGNTIQTKLTKAYLNSATNFNVGDGGTSKETVDGSEKIAIAVNSTVTGTFYEKDSNGNYIIPVNVCVGKSDGTISTDANGNVKITNSASPDSNLSFSSGELGEQTLYIKLDDKGNAPVTYYTTDSNGNQIGSDGNQTAYFDGTGTVMLTHVVQSAELNPNAKLDGNSAQNDIVYIGSYNQDGAFTYYDSTELSGKWLFYGGESQDWSEKAWSDLIDITQAPTISGGTDTTFVSGNVDLTLNGVSFTANVYQFTQAMASYQYNCSQLATKGEDNIVAEAQTLYGSWETINTNKTDAEKSFIVHRLGSYNTYFGIYKQLSVANNSVSYGDTTATATATTIDGKTVNGVKVDVGEFTTTDGLKATIYGTYTVNDYTFTLSSQITVKRREITVTIVGGSKTYDGVAVDVKALDVTIENALVSDKDNLISTIKEKLKCSSTVKDAGTYTITADFEGNTYYHATITNGGTYVINPCPVSVTIDDKTSVYGDDLASLTVSSVSGLIDGNIYDYITLTKVDGNDVGSYDIVGEDKNSNDNYVVTFANTGNKATYTITARPLTVKVSVSNNLIYGDKLSCGNSSDDAAVKVTLDGVISADQEIIFNAIKFTINGDATHTDVSGNELNNLVLNAGNYSLTASVTSSNYTVSYNYGETSETSCSFTIERLRLNVSFDEASSTYGEAIQTSAELYKCITVKYTDGSKYEGEQPFELTAVDGSKIALTTKSVVGGYGVLISNINPNYMISVDSEDATTENCVVSGVYTINKREIIVTIDDRESTYGDAIVNLTANVTSGSIVNGDTDVYTLSTDATNTSTVGSNYKITGKQGSNKNYTVNFVSKTDSSKDYGTYTINKREITVTIDQHSKVYDGNGVTALDEDKITLENVVTGEQSSILNWVKSHFVPITDANANTSGYNITFNTTEQPANYTITYSADKYVITKRPITVKIDNKSSTYGEQLAVLTASVTSETKPVSGHELYGNTNAVITLSTTATSTSDATTYPIIGNVNNANYNVTFVNKNGEEGNGTYTITKRELTVTLSGSESVYGEQIKTSADLYKLATIDKVVEKDKNTQLFTLQVVDSDGNSVVNTNKVGNSYLIRIVADSINKNYTIANVETLTATYTITARPVTVKIADATSIYGELSAKLMVTPVATSTTNLGFVKADADKIYDFITLNVVSNYVDNGSTVDVSTAKVDAYYIVGTNSNSNYTVTFVNEAGTAVYGTYTITAREIAITVDMEKSSQYGDEPNLTDLIVIGANVLVNNDEVADVFNLALQSTTSAQTKARRTLASTQSTTSTHLDAGTYGLSIGLKTANYKVIKVNDDEVTIVASGSVESESENTSHIVEKAYTIKQREITITIGDGEKTYDGAKPDLSGISITITGAVEGQSGAISKDDEAKLVSAVRNAFKLEGKDIDAIINAGSYTISSTFIENDNYVIKAVDGSSGYTTGTYKITPCQITVSFDVITKTYGDTVVTTDELLEKVAVTSGTLATGDSKQDLFTLSVKNGEQLVASTTGVGNYDVVYEVLNSNYQIDFGTDFGTGKYVITAKAITLVVTAGTSVYGDDIANSTVALKDGFTLVGSDTLGSLKYTISHTATKGSDVDSYPITAQDSDNTDNYNISFEFANDVTDYIITKRPITITIGSDAKTYDGKAISDAVLNGISIIINGVVEGEEDSLAQQVREKFILQVDDNQVTAPTSAGKYTIVSTFTGNNNYVVYTTAESNGYTNGIYTINKLDITVTLSLTNNELPESDDLSINVSATMSWKEQSWSADKAQYVIKSGDNVVATIGGDGKVTPQSGKRLPAGSYTVTLKQYNDTNFNVTDVIDATLEITVADDSYSVSITFKVGDVIVETGRVYDGQTVEPVISVTKKADNSVITNYSYEISKIGSIDSGEKIKNAGTYQVSVKVDGKLYGTAEFEITKRPITITIGSDAKTYDGKAISDTVLNGISIIINGAVEGQIGAVNETDKSALISAVRKDFILKLGNTVVNPINAGSYVISSTFTGNDNYVVDKTVNANSYTAGYKLGTYTITPREIQLTVKDGTSSVYGEPIATDLINKVTIAGDVYDGKSSIIDVTTNATQGDVVGTYNLFVTLKNTNYCITKINDKTINGETSHPYVVANKYEIKKRAIAVTIKDVTSVYGNEKAKLDYEVTSAYDIAILSGDKDVFAVTCNADSTKPVGSYDIIGQKGTNENYDVTFVSATDSSKNYGTYTIEPRTITVKIDNKSSTYGYGISNSSQGIGGLTVTYATDSLKVVEEDESIYQFITLAVMNGTEDITNEISSTSVGTYSITGANVANSNYDVTFVNENDSAKDYGIYTITAREIAITVDMEKSSQYGDEPNLTDLIVIGANVLVNNDEVADVFNLALQSTTSAQTKARRTLASTQSTTSTHLDAGTYGLSIGLKTANYKVIKVNDTEVTIVASSSAESGSGTETSYVVTEAYKITPREITITIGDGEKIYDGTKPDLSGISITITGAVEGQSGAISKDDEAKLVSAVRNAFKLEGKDIDAIINAGSYTISSTFIENDNYVIKAADGSSGYTTGIYKITPCQITVSVSKAESVYGNPLKANLLGNASIKEIIYDNLDKILSVTTTAQEDSPVNSYDLHVELISGNYIIVKINDSEPTLVTGTTNKYVVANKYEITARKVIVNIQKGTKVYDGQVPSEFEIEIKDDASVGTNTYISLPEGEIEYTVKLNNVVGKTYINVGTYTISGTVSASTNYSYTVNDGTYTITKRPITITIGSDEKTYDGVPITDDERDALKIFGGAAWDGLIGTESAEVLTALRKALTLTVTDNAKDVKAGGYEVTGTFFHDNYEATINNGKYTINPCPITVIIENKKSYYGDTLAKLTYTTQDSIVIGDDLGVTLTKAEGNNVGEYNITGTWTNTNYNVTFKNGEKAYTITPRPITIEIGKGSKTYDGATPDLSKISIIIKGTTITQTQVGAVNDADESALISAVRNAFELTGEDVNVINAGSYVISSTFTGNGNYVVYATAESNGYTNGTYTINPRKITVTIDNKSSTYGNGITVDEKDAGIGGLTVTVNRNSDQVLSGDNIYNFITLAVMNGDDVIDDIASANAGGTYYIVGADVNANDNYAVTFTNADNRAFYTIDKRPLTVSFNQANLTSVYGESIQDSAILYNSVTIDNIVEKGNDAPQLFELQVVDARNDIVKSASDVGAYNIKISGINSNYKIAILNGGNVDEKESYTVENLYTITKREITVKIDDKESTYGNDIVSLTASVTSEIKPVSGHNLYEGENAVITLSCDGLKSTSNVGAYQITGSVNNDNYDVTFENGTYTITKRTVHVTINSAESIYGYGCATLSAKENDDSTYKMLPGHSLSDLITLVVMNGDDVITDDIDSTKVGTYAITGANVENSNYDIVFDNNNANLYAIKQRPITVSFGTITKTYGDTVATTDDLLEKVAVTSGTLATGDSKQGLFTLSVKNVTSTTGVGNYAVVYEVLNSNYQIDFGTDFGKGKYVITAKAITLVVTAGTSVYGDAIADSTVALKDGLALVGKDTIETLSGGYTLTHVATQGSNVGTYPITAQDSNDVDNYNISFEFAKDKDSGKTVNYYSITKRPVTYTVNSATIYRYQDDWSKLNGILNDKHLYGEVDNVVEGETLKFTYKVIAKVDESGNTIYLTEDNFGSQIKLGSFTIKAMATDDPVNANYDITYVDGTLNVDLPKVSVNADNITKEFTYSPDGIHLFSYADQINGLLADDKLPIDNANARSFKAELKDEQGNVVLGGTGTLSGVVPAGRYTLVISIVFAQYYQWDEDVTTEYTITVKKKDISDFIILQGLNEYLQDNEKYQGWITNVRGGVYAEIADENYENIRVDSIVKFNGEEVFDLTQCGEYVLKAIINDDNYCGTKEFTFCVIQSVATEMGKLMTMSNEYSSKDDFATRLSNINQMKAVVETIKTNADYMLQVEQNKTYQTYIDKVDTLYNQLANDWTDYVNDNKQDVEIAKKVWQDTVAKAVATITLLGAATFVAKRRLGL